MNYRRKLIVKQSLSVFIGLFIGICALALTLFMGPQNTAQFFVVEQNLGVEYRDSWNHNHAKAIGVSKVFGVPIWENSQGLGSRMPNLITQPTQSPIIFLGEKLPVEYIVILRNLLALLSALVVLNLAVLSWSDRQIYLRLIFMDIAILGPYFLFTIQNDWFVIADQYLGGCLIVAGFLHVSWYQAQTGNNETQYPSVVLFAFVFGFSNLLVGHVLFIHVVIIAVISFFLFNFLNFKKILGSIALLLLFLLLVVLIAPQIIELSSQVWNVQSIAHSSQPSIFDVFMPKRLRVYRLQWVIAFVSGGFQPLLRLVNEAGVRTEFLGLLFMPLILRRFIKSLKINSTLSQMLKVVVLALGFIFLNLTFAGVLARSGLPIVSILFDFHVWQLSHFFLVLVIVLVTVLFGYEQQAESTSKFFYIGNQLILIMAVIVALMYPIIMVVKDVPRSNPETIAREFVKDNFGTAQILTGLEKKYRSILLNETVIQSLTGVDKNILRSGYPLVNSVIYSRSSNTLSYTEQRFRSVFDPSIEDCQPEVLDLLSVNAIVYEAGRDDICSKNLKNYYRSGDEINFLEVAATPLILTAKPTQFSSWSISGTPERNPIEPCPLFEKKCLSGLTVTKLEPNTGAPFMLCEEKCLFNYRWSAPSSARQVLVPENYDRTIEVRDQSTGTKLQTANYQGLLAVEIPSGETNGVFEATIKPDSMMWTRVSATYIHTFVLLATLFLISVRGIKARRNSQDEVMLNESTA